MRSLRARVAATTAMAVAVGGALVALVGMAFDDALARGREDAHLRDAAAVFAAELREPDADPESVWTDETREISTSGVAVAVFAGERRLAGDEHLDLLAAGECATRGMWRSCSVRVEADRVAIAGRRQERLAEERMTLGLALALAVLATSLVGALASRRVASWSVAPLARLAGAVARVHADAAGTPELGPDEGVEEVDRLRSALREALSRLAAAVVHARRFAGDAAHELRTPLTSMRGELELLAEHVHDPAEAAAVARVRRTTERLGLLVERLLVLARPAGALEAEETVEVRDVIEELVAELPAATRARVTTTLADDAPPLRGDGPLLGAMIGAALENAIKFGADGPVAIQTRVTGQELVIDIDDAGPGIAPGDRDGLFRAFQRSAEARASGIPGHGIGLSLVAHVAALHGGSARFEDGAPGARLRIVLPLRREPVHGQR